MMPDKLRVLYVDDEIDLLIIGKLFLEKSGEFTVTTAISASEAIRLFEQGRFDTIISDYQMPEMNGIQFLIEIRKKFRKLPFILFTGRGREEVVIEAINHGVDFYLQKGGDPKAQFAELMLKIRQAVQRHNAETDLAKSEANLQAIIANTDDIIASYDNEIRLLVYNRAASEIYRSIFDIELRPGLCTLDLFPESMRGFWDTHNERALAGESFSIEFNLPLPSGQKRFFESSYNPICKDGVVVGFSTFTRDITERKRAEDELSASYEQISAAEEELRGQFDMLLQNEKDLRKSEARYRLISENTADVIWTLDYNTRKFTYVSPSVQKLRGYSPDEVMSQTMAEALTPESMEAVARLLQDGISGRKSGDTSRHVTTNLLDQPCKDGSVVSTEVVSTVVFDEQGHPVEIIGISRDITERKNAEKLLKGSEIKYRTLFDSSSDAILIHDITGRILDVNQVLCDRLGYSREEMLLMTPMDFDSPEYAELVPERLRQLLNSKHQIFETCNVRKDGTRIPTEINVRIIDYEGEPVCLSVGRDITERKMAEDALRESESHISSIIRVAPIGIGVVSNRIIMTVNNRLCQMTGYTAEELIGKSSCVLYPTPEEYDYVGREKYAQIAQNGTGSVETRWQKKDGTIIDILLSSTPVDPSDLSIGVTFTALDLTERKNAEEALQHQSATLSILNGIISTANKADNLPELLNSILEESLHLLDFDVGGVYLVDRSTRTAQVVYSKNLPPDLLAEIQTLPIDQKPYDTLFIKNELIITENYAQIAPGRSKKYGLLSMASIPLLSKGVAIGALNVASKRRQAISEEEKQTLISISRELGSTIERMAAEEAVKKTATNLETLFNSIDDLVFVLDMQGNILAVNDTVQKRLLYTSVELTGTNVFLLHVPERRDEALRIVEGMIAGTIDSCHVPVLAKDGTRIEVETKVTRGWWNGNEALIGVSRDITERKVAEDELRFSEKKFAAAFEASPDPIAITDMQTGIILDINSAFEEWSGYVLDEISGKTTSDMNFWVSPEERDAFIRQLKTQGSVHKKNVTFRTKKGEIRDILFSANMFGTGNKTYMLSLAEDITERRQKEDALAKSEETFRSLLERVPSIGVQGYSPDHTVVYWNEANTRIYGYTAEEAIGRDIRDLLVPIPAREEVTKAIARMAESGIPEPSAELELLHKDGSLVPVFSSHAVVKIPGRSTIQFCFDVDLSERKKAEETIQKNEERFRTIIHSMQFGIFIIDAQTHKILEANPKALEMIGCTSELVLGSVCHHFICPAELGRCPVTDLLQTVDSSERVLLNQRGKKIPIVKSVIKTMLGGTEVLIESFIDITDRKVAEDTLLRVNQKLNVLSQLTRKDLTNQTFVLSSYLELVKNQLAGQDQVLDTLEKGFEAVRTIHRTIEYSKDYQDMGSKPPKWQNVKMVLLFGLSHISIGKIQHSLETENLEIFADSLLEKVYQRLFENSVKHGDHVTRVRVWYAVTPEGATIFFEDDGIGIWQQEKEQIFLRKEGTSASRGSLVFVREILDITGITIQETGEPGMGARFEIVVPKGMWRLSVKGE